MYEQDLKDIEIYTQRITDAQEQLKTAIKDTRTSLEATTEEIMASGGPRMGLTGKGETAAEMRARSAKELSDALDAASEALKNFSVDDVLGSGDAMKHAAEVAAKAIEAGGKVLASALGS